MNKTLLIRLAVVVAFSLAALAYLLFFHVKQQHHVSAKDGWLFGIEQLPHAKKLATQQQRPLLIYLKRSPCKYCDDFEENYLTLPSISEQIQPMVKISITVKSDDTQAQSLLKRYQVLRFPAVVIKHNPHSEAIRLHVLMDLQQVWLPIPDYKRGNYTPLSETTLNLALSETLKVAQDLAEQQTTPPKR
ncbi:hypothetical protein Q4519_06460 [Motilimonas sp. 1_MG-2023]|uniref:thioredoxin family protein n=1 Tax=Motilimonas sp. 1_MG-2023 TaxID=3062672 RepID=UPI0026E194AB|nr:hypothetical protein [Motilimonas sp. 1_MG-2023]MDO6525324.1 hypothetical protein [Motilimonas sp. 1_MG-2023]